MKIKSKSIEMVDVHSIVENPKNANRHSIEQIKRLEKLIEFQGFRNPLIVSKRTGFLVVGHGRLDAAKNLGMEKVPVIFQDFENEAQEYAYLVSDNEIARWSELDKQSVFDELENLQLEDIELLGIEDFSIPEVEIIEPQSDEDSIPEVTNHVTKKGDVWLLGNHRVMCGDSTMIDDFEKLMNGKKADMLFTDPPYGDGHAAMEVTNIQKQAEYRKKGIAFNASQKIKNDDDLEIMDEVAKNVSMFLKPETPKLVFFKWKKWEEVKEKWSVFGEPSSCCVWDRDEMAAAVFIFNPCHEFAFFWGSLAKKQNTSNLSNVWRCKKEKENRELHPTVKPVEICQNAIDAACVQNGLVIDPFGGSGSTLIACQNTGRTAHLMELDEKYCDVIVERFQKYTGKKAVLESSKKTFDELKGEK